MENEFSLRPASAMYEMHMKNVFREYQTMCPEEWLARYSHTIGCFSGGDFQYSDPVFHAWVHKLSQCLSNPFERNVVGLIDSYRMQYLSASEREELAKLIANHEF